MSLPRRCPTSGAVLATAGAPLNSPCATALTPEPQEQEQEEGGDGDDTRAAEARLDVAAKASGVKMPLTIVWRGDLDPGRPRPVVLRAYGAYGLCADVSFQPDDLPLLDRCAAFLTVLLLLRAALDIWRTASPCLSCVLGVIRHATPMGTRGGCWLDSAEQCAGRAAEW